MSDERDIVMTIKHESIANFLREAIYQNPAEKERGVMGPGLKDILYFKIGMGFTIGKVLKIETQGDTMVYLGDGSKMGWKVNINLFYQAFYYDDFQTGMLLVHKEIEFKDEQQTQIGGPFIG